VNGAMAWPAYPQRPGDQLFLAEQLLKALFSVQVLGDEVVASELGDGAPAEFTVVWLGWEFEHDLVVQGQGTGAKMGSDEGFHLTPESDPRGGGRV